MVANRIVTRGMGKNRGRVGRVSMITAGMGGIYRFIKNVVKLGQSGYKRALRELEEVVVWAKLIRVNDSPPTRRLEGSIIARVPATDFVVRVLKSSASRARKAAEDLKITVKRIT